MTKCTCNKIDCCDCGNHPYAEKTCPQCGYIYCYNCCTDQNVDQGGNHEIPYMTCPHCGQDHYQN